ncbi:PAS domain-containing methyl-accepting chemotaxis protein [Pokkaliibacter sp. MBI-7]|uniref:methyl-accepting chemotaxis protein n=1 Tax=Pokkaliibacter sp. MBI-7 TaxID=3040600 RepID=UPI002449841E|nr:PAS domain-containing methyl-accepting chemotaxis protein [Pokkaliibacter sp. MBI-7]MDH2432791.1 PAS domain-containing methyl-accepting chemotaxis protein [Pokkaliibacter sp. MBI-7]
MRKNLPVNNVERSFSASEQLISTTDLKGQITHCNEAFIKISGFTREELIGAPHNLVRHPDMPPSVFQHMWTTLKAGKPWMGIVKNRCKNGDFYWVDAYVTPILEAGKVVGYESVRAQPSADQKKWAAALYERINQGKSTSHSTFMYLLGQYWFVPLMGIISLLSTWYLPASISAPLTLILTIGSGALCVSKVLGKLTHALRFTKNSFTDPLIAQTYTEAKGSFGMLEMALISEQSRLRTILGRIGDSANYVAKKSEEAGAFNQQILRSLDTQQRETEQSASAMHEMAATINEVAENVQLTAEETKQAATTSAQGQQVAQVTLQAISKLADQVKNMSESVNELDSHTLKITEAVDIIRTIAEQTNLLALNAAIEAARAGEQGRGFAVVADEVRSLANRTQSSTQHIHEIIENLRNGATTAVQTAQDGLQVADQGLLKVEETSQALEQILASISRISDMSQQMGVATEEQAHVAEDINQQVTRISSLAGDSVSQASAANTATLDLLNASEDLRNLVSRFTR